MTLCVILNTEILSEQVFLGVLLQLFLYFQGMLLSCIKFETLSLTRVDILSRNIPYSGGFMENASVIWLDLVSEIKLCFRFSTRP